uniref:Peptidase S1 domain-containing protein n=1 Tax=Trichogramma kaykai TaxID=54128 RepID=A0ABD2X1S7_9HYME
MPFHCGGVIISKYHVLTAAHCILGSPESEVNRIEVVAGSNKRDDPTSVVRKVESIVVHDQPRLFYHTGDIAIIKVKEAFKFNHKIHPAILPHHNYVVPPGTFVLVTGWGLTEDMYAADSLRVIVMKTVDIEECRKSWKQWFGKTVPFQKYILDFNKVVDHSMICIQGDKGQSICALRGAICCCCCCWRGRTYVHIYTGVLNRFPLSATINPAYACTEITRARERVHRGVYSTIHELSSALEKIARAAPAAAAPKLVALACPHFRDANTLRPQQLYTCCIRGNNFRCSTNPWYARADTRSFLLVLLQPPPPPLSTTKRVPEALLRCAFIRCTKAAAVAAAAADIACG